MNTIDDTYVTNFIDNTNLYYLENTKDDVNFIEPRRPIELSDVYFVKIKSITFEDKAPRKEALENVLSSMRIPDINFIYLILGEKNKVTFYYGISKNLNQGRNNSERINIRELGESVLKHSIEGNFRGSTVDIVDEGEKKKIFNVLQNYKYANTLEGIPGLNNNDEAENFQRVDRLIDVMLGDEFAFLVTAQSLSLNTIIGLENNIFDFFQKLVPLSKKTVQVNESEGASVTNTDTKGTNSTKGKSWDNGSSEQKTTGSTDSGSSSGKSFSKNDSVSTSKSKSDSTNESYSTSDSVAVAKGTNKGKGKSESIEYVNKKVQDWMKYIDESALKRIDYGKGKGVFITSITLLSNDELVLKKLSNTCTSLYSGDVGNKVPLKVFSLSGTTGKERIVRNLQIPIGSFRQSIKTNEIVSRTALSQLATANIVYLANWFSVNELGIIAGLPRKEVVGIALNEEVEFGLNYMPVTNKERKLHLGSLVQSGIPHDDIEVSIDKKELSKHIFVCGVTGSGKTTTCMTIIEQSNMPYLVIEPAKTEYRILAKEGSDVMVFTLGKDDVAPFRLNPLEFLPTETISSHVDMVKASIEAAFDMEAAIPQIIESALYECYEKYGWNIQTGKNNRFPNPFADGVLSFPTLSDLINETASVVDRQGFDIRLKNDYLGSIRARLMGLTVGAKGEMLNTRRSVDFTKLIHGKVILELENIKSGSEKSLIMGFILSNLCEAIKYEYKKNRCFKHITLIEEAHRLLSKYMPGDSLNKKNGVETFADMLAEIRKYGESLIIADQIPNKMTPDVLKNTNTKIVHKIFAQDDKEAIGDTISLTAEQKAFLSHLITGRAVVFSQDWEKSVQVQIKQLRDTTNDVINDDELHNISLMYYAENYKRGFVPELSCLAQKPTVIQVKEYLKHIDELKITTDYCLRFIKRPTAKQNHMDDFINSINKLKGFYKIEELACYLNNQCYKEPNSESENLLISLIHECVYNNLVIDDEFLNKYKLLINKSLN